MNMQASFPWVIDGCGAVVVCGGMQSMMHRVS